MQELDTTKREHFIEFLEKADFTNAEKILTESEYSMWHYYFDNKTGNSIIHLAILSLRNQLYKIQRDPDRKKYIESCFKLVKLMVSLEFPYHTINKRGELPAEILINAELDKIRLKNDIAREYVKLFESRGQYLYPGRKYVINLSLFRSSSKAYKVCEIPDLDHKLNQYDEAKLTLHQRQSLFERNYKANKSSNLVVLNIGFIISDTPRDDFNHKPIFITFPFKIDDNVIMVSQPKNGRTHSESVMCDYLKLKIDLIVDKLKEKIKNINGHKVYALVLDLHSTNEICEECQLELHDLQCNYEAESFLSRMEKALRNAGCILPKKNISEGIKGRMIGDRGPKLKVIIRASGLEDFSSTKDIYKELPKAVLVSHPPRDIKSHPIKTLFHLPPNRNWQPHSNDFADPKITPFATEDDNKYMEEYNKKFRKSCSSWKHENYPEHEKMRDFALIFPQFKMCCENYTAFSNTGGGVKDVKENNPQTEFMFDFSRAQNVLKV